MSKNQRIFIEIRKDKENVRDGRIFYGRGALINSLFQQKNRSWFKNYFENYEILEIVSVKTKQPKEDFKELIENWKGYEESKEDENPKIVREDDYDNVVWHKHSAKGITSSSYRKIGPSDWP